MLRSTIEDTAVAAAKAWSHTAVETRHVVYAICRTLSKRPETHAIQAAVKAALEPHGTSVGIPEVSAEARELIARCISEDAAIAVALQGFEGDSDTGAQAGPVATARETVPDESPPSAEGKLEDIDAVLAELDGLVGLGPVKAKVRQVMAVVRANRERSAAGMPSVNPSLHLVFTGAAGTGKTTVARLVARLYAATGALTGARFVEVTRGDLIAGYVGQTALKTQHVIDGTVPGVLFIDEAYALTASHGVDYANECIATLVKNMEDRRSELAVIAAGYSAQMADFIDSNPGLRSRFKTFIEFPYYNPDELVAIFRGFAGDAMIALGAGVEERAGELFAEARSSPDFGNARYARSVWEQAYANMAARAADDGVVELSELAEIVVDDLPGLSRGPDSRRGPLGFR